MLQGFTYQHNIDMDVLSPIAFNVKITCIEIHCHNYHCFNIKQPV